MSGAIRNSILTQLPPATRYMTLALVVTSAILMVIRSGLTKEDLKQLGYGGQDATLAFPFLVAIPGLALFRPWTLLTAAFVEVNLIELLVTAVSLALAGRYLERVWGYVEFLKFSAVCIVVPNVMSVAVSYLQSFALQGRGEFLFGQSFHGMMALQTAFLVAFTQLIPEHQIQFFGGVAKLKVKQLPMLYVTFSNIMCLVGYLSPFILIQFGWLVSWAYLRFIKDGGDRSETFSFAHWFPPFLQKYVNRIANIVFGIFVTLHILKPWNDVEQGLASPPGNARAEAERRRALALQALDQRLQSSKQPVPVPVAVSQPLSQSTSSAGPNLPSTALPAEPKRAASLSGIPAFQPAAPPSPPKKQAPTAPAQPEIKQEEQQVVFDADKE